MLKLDLKDKKIIYELERNARAPLSEIAKKIGSSKQLVKYKIQQLEKRGIIEGYNAIIDTSKLGYTTYRVYIRWKNIGHTKQDNIMTEISAFKEITIAFKFDGHWDYGIGVFVKTLKEFYTFWDRIMTYRQYIDTYAVHVYSPIIHFSRDFLLEEKSLNRKTMILGAQEKVDFDNEDITILKILCENTRRPLTEIAKMIKKSPNFVIQRVKDIERKGIIQGYRPILNWTKLGYKYYKVDIALDNYSKRNDMIKWCQNTSYIVQIDRAIGGEDFEIEFYVKDEEHFDQLMKEFTDTFNGQVKNYTYFTVKKTYIEQYMPQ